MKTSIEEFNSELRSEVIAQAESFGDLTENAFFEYFTNYLLEAEVIDTADRCFYQPPEQNIRIDGYGGDPIDNDSTLNIIVSDYSNSEEIKSINRSDIDLMCKRASNFISNSLTSTVHLAFLISSIQSKHSPINPKLPLCLLVPCICQGHS